jgi:hypothetical protein
MSVCVLCTGRDRESEVELQGKHPFVLQRSDLIPQSSHVKCYFTCQKFAVSSSLIRAERRHALTRLRETERWELAWIVFRDAVRTAQEGNGRQAIDVWRNIEGRSCSHCYSGKTISITYCEFVFVALGIIVQCACAILSSVACPAVQYFSHIS